LRRVFARLHASLPPPWPVLTACFDTTCYEPPADVGFDGTPPATACLYYLPRASLPVVPAYSFHRYTSPIDYQDFLSMCFQFYTRRPSFLCLSTLLPAHSALRGLRHSRCRARWRNLLMAYLGHACSGVHHASTHSTRLNYRAHLWAGVVKTHGVALLATVFCLQHRAYLSLTTYTTPATRCAAVPATPAPHPTLPGLLPHAATAALPPATVTYPFYVYRGRPRDAASAVVAQVGQRGRTNAPTTRSTRGRRDALLPAEISTFATILIAVPHHLCRLYLLPPTYGDAIL